MHIDKMIPRVSKATVNRLLLVVILFSSLVLAAACNPTSTSPTTTPTTPPTTSEPTAEPSPTPSTTPSPEPASPAGELKVHFIDVGQGDAILIDLEDTEILIDGGDRSPGVTGYLDQYVDGPLEVMVATHPHADHIGGLIAVLDAFEVGQVWHNGDTSDSKTYSDFMSGVSAEGAEVHIARLHDVIKAGDLELYVHHPANLEGSTNNNSIVLHLAYGDIDFLFTGDAEQDAEAEMLALDSLPVPEVEILKVGHHGSRTASSADFLAVTSPEVAIYMAGVDNSYGHPHAETIAALNAIGAQIYGTDVNGTIIVTTDGETYLVNTER
jgi:competence protein ComEC